MVKMKNMDKPWEDDSVDHWKTDGFAQGDMIHALTEESSFAVLFPSYREAYLREACPQAVQRRAVEHSTRPRPRRAVDAVRRLRADLRTRGQRQLRNAAQGNGEGGLLGQGTVGAGDSGAPDASSVGSIASFSRGFIASTACVAL